MSNQVNALLVERAGYVRRGLKDRVKQVDDALSALGYKMRDEAPAKETASHEPEIERATSSRAPKRRG
jgi:hypothetical protein